MQSMHQDEFLYKIESKYGRNNYVLDITDKPSREAIAAFVYLPGTIALLSIYITLAFLPRLHAPVSQKNAPMDEYHLHTCRVLHGYTESSRYWERRGLLGFILSCSFPCLFMALAIAYN